MTLSAHDALIYIMLIVACADTEMSDVELSEMEINIVGWPVFEGFDRSRLGEVVNACTDLLNGDVGLDGALDLAVGALPDRLHDTAYALAVDVAASDLALEQEELRLLEMLRDRLTIDRLVTAAIETGARARYKRLEPAARQ